MLVLEYPFFFFDDVDGKNGVGEGTIVMIMKIKKKICSKDSAKMWVAPKYPGRILG